MIRGLTKGFPFLLIILPIIGFFVSEDDPSFRGNGYIIGSILRMMIFLPLWGKILSIIIGVVWVLTFLVDDETDPAS